MQSTGFASSRSAMRMTSTSWRILLLTVVLIGAIMVPLVPNYSILGGLTSAFLFLLIPTAQGAVDLVNNTVTALLKATALAKLDFPKGLPRSSRRWWRFRPCC